MEQARLIGKARCINGGLGEASETFTLCIKLSLYSKSIAATDKEQHSIASCAMQYLVDSSNDYHRRAPPRQQLVSVVVTEH